MRIEMYLLLWLALAVNSVYAQSHNLKLHYDEPAQQWEETLPLGNGKIGLMPDGGIHAEEIVLNDITLWSGEPQDANNYEAHTYLPEIRALLKKGENDKAQQLINEHFVCLGPGSGGPQWGCYQTFGTLKLDFGETNDNQDLRNYRRELDIEKAVAALNYEQDGIKYKREYFTSFYDDVGVIKLSANSKGKVSVKISVDRSERAESKVKGRELQLIGQLDNGSDGFGMKFIARVQAKQKGGKQRTEGNSIVIEDADEVEIYVVTDTDFRGNNFLEESQRNLQSALSKSYKNQIKEHTKNFQKLFNRLSLTLGNQEVPTVNTKQRLVNFNENPDNDPALAALFYQFGRYLSISSTRIGLLPPNLQGLWAHQIHTPWNGDYHLDVNVQMNHWHLGTANLSELNMPLVDLVNSLIEPGAKTAKAYYNADGWVAHVITNVWGFTEPGEAASWGIANAGSGWLCNNLWENYLYTKDKDYLREIYPILRGAAQFYNSSLMEYPKTGWLVTGPSVSPENSFKLGNGNHANVTMGPTIDNQIVWELFNNVIYASDVLELEDTFVNSLKQKLDRLAPIVQVAKDGRIMEWIEEYEEMDPQHRHISHLYGLYPAHQITVNRQPEWADAARKTLNVRGDDGPSWAIAYKMIFWAKLHDGERAYKLLKQLLTPRVETHINYGAGGGTYANLFTAGPPFQIDGNFGGAAAIGEMLIQEDEGTIYLLPAIPEIWKSEGSVSGIKARGGYEIDMKWKDGKVINFKIFSHTTTEPVNVVVNGEIKTIKPKKKSV